MAKHKFYVTDWGHISPLTGPNPDPEVMKGKVFETDEDPDATITRFRGFFRIYFEEIEMARQSAQHAVAARDAANKAEGVEEEVMEACEVANDEVAAAVATLNRVRAHAFAEATKAAQLTEVEL